MAGITSVMSDWLKADRNTTHTPPRGYFTLYSPTPDTWLGQTLNAAMHLSHISGVEGAISATARRKLYTIWHRGSNPQRERQVIIFHLQSWRSLSRDVLLQRGREDVGHFWCYKKLIECPHVCPAFYKLNAYVTDMTFTCNISCPVHHASNNSFPPFTN